MTPQPALDIGEDEIRRGGPLNVATQIAQAIRSRILAGLLRTGDLLPGERALAEQLSRNRDTIKDAYRQLAAEGFLIIRDRNPPQVRKPPPPRAMSTERYRDVVEAIRKGVLNPAQIGFCADYECTWDEFTVEMESSVDTASESVRSQLVLPHAGKVVVRHLVEFARDVPVQIRRSVMPAWLAADSEIVQPYRQPWAGGTVGELMHLGHIPGKVIERLVARPATIDEAAALYLPTGLHVWEFTRTFYCLAGANPMRPMEVSNLILPEPGNSLLLVTHL